MPAPISVIIPTLNSAQDLQNCLAALGAGIMDGLLAEVIFADGGSTDETAEIAEAVGAKFLSTPKGRGSQMAVAAQSAKGEWLMFLHSDSVLDRDWQSAVIPHLRETSKAGYFRLRFDDTSFPARLVARWANFRARWFGLPYGDQGLLISRKLYKDIGGYPQIPLMEDVAIAKRLRGRLVMLPAFVQTSADKYRRQGWIRRSWLNFGMLCRYKLGANPADLAAKYYR